ncbi:hypothetical protein [Vibrio vulnificus]|uniref:hypothetical protein n=1 Tax=Vibrio vulnificus TaxID=672 RepID=UPI001F4F8860|nr:hypothetical protein [Vibrio vulnificus]
MNVSPLWAAIVAALAIPALADDYALQQASEADTSRWSCEPCESDGKWIGEISFGLGYQNNDGASRFNNWVPQFGVPMIPEKAWVAASTPIYRDTTKMGFTAS